MFTLEVLSVNLVFQTFRRLLISKLQDEFENRTRNVEGESGTVEVAFFHWVVGTKRARNIQQGLHSGVCLRLFSHLT